MADAKLLSVSGAFPFAGAVTFSSFSLNQSADKVSVVFQAREAATITRLFVRVGTITGTTPTYRIGLQGVNSSGQDDGTFKGATNNAKKTFSPSALGWSANSGHWLDLDESVTVARGDYLAWVVEYASGTVDASNFAAVTVGNTAASAQNFPHAFQIDNGARTFVAGAVACYGYGSATDAYGQPMEAAYSGSVSSTAEIGMKFSLPAGWGDTYQVCGMRLWFAPSSGKTVTMTLYQGGGASDATVLQQVAFDTDLSGSVSRLVTVWFDESSLSDLTFGSEYRIALVGSDASTHPVIGMTQAAAADWDAWPLGQAFGLTSRSGSGSWTDAPVTRLFAELLLADITEPSGGGGGSGGRSLIRYPGMALAG